MTSNNRSLFFLISFILISLYSFYFDIPILSVIGASYLVSYSFFQIHCHSARLKFIYIPISYYVLIIIGFIGIIFFELPYDLTRIFGLYFLLVLSIALSLEFKKQHLFFLLKYFILLHIIFFYIQLFGYYIFDINISALKLWELDTRNLGGTFRLPILNKFIRPSGLFNEPGTYACFVAPAIALFSRYNNKETLLFYLAWVSLLLSFSTFGLVFFVLIGLFLLKGMIKKIFFFLLLFIGGIPYAYWKIFVHKSPLEEGSAIGFRLEYIKAALDNFTSLEGLFFGKGIFSSEAFSFTVSGADNDSGLLFYTLYSGGGIVFSVLLIYLCYMFLRLDRAGFLTLLIISISKLSLFALIVPVYWFMAIEKGKKL